MTEITKVSIIMPTYNGEKNIIEQLDSLKAQSYPIHEVIMKDDGSTDKTVQIIQNYINKYSLKGWRIEKNQINLGWRDNFFEGLNSATGELIFPSDQDDIWEKNKIKNMVQVFKKHPRANVVISDYDELIEDGGISYPCSKRKINHVKDNQIIFTKKNVYLNRPGWVYGIRKSFMDEINLYKETAITPVHDITMWSTAVLTDSLYYLNQVTGTWRKHGESAIREENGKDSVFNKRQIRLAKLNRLKEITISDILYIKNTKRKIENKEAKISQLNALIREYDRRMEIIDKEKLSLILFNLPQYTSLHPIIADIYFLIKNKGEN
ncbi:glycosyltransferase [Enterococcus thailandicus]|uniref:glycosyltransferase n=1 Tax=Enterococcus TaxID=1350 RepID=UPI0022E7DB3C|nr:glycosyltransferase [Enterococcus thailandicus]